MTMTMTMTIYDDDANDTYIFVVDLLHQVD